MRLFIGIWPTEAGRAALEEVQRRARRRGLGGALRFTPPEQCHLTLVFLGEVDEARVEALVRRVRDAAAGWRSCELGLGGLGCFPDLTRPRVFWAGVTGDREALATLQRGVASVTAGWRAAPSEGAERTFHPHVTLARAREIGGKDRAVLRELVEETRFAVDGAWPATRVRLMRSDLGPGGARYVEVAGFELGGYSK